MPRFPQKDKTWQHSPKQTPNHVVYKDAFLHAPSQARRLRPNSLAKDAHNQLQSRFSPEWKLILWQELLNLPETHTATDHKGTSPFPKEGRSKPPANNTAMAYHGLQDIKDKHAQRTVQTKQIPCKVINIIHKNKSHICQRTDHHKRLQTHHITLAAASKLVMNSAFDFSQLHYVLRLATTAPVKPKGFLMTPSPLTITANTPRAHQ